MCSLIDVEYAEKNIQNNLQSQTHLLTNIRTLTKTTLQKNCNENKCFVMNPLSLAHAPPFPNQLRPVADHTTVESRDYWVTVPHERQKQAGANPSGLMIFRWLHHTPLLLPSTSSLPCPIHVYCNVFRAEKAEKFPSLLSAWEHVRQGSSVQSVIISRSIAGSWVLDNRNKTEVPLVDSIIFTLHQCYQNNIYSIDLWAGRAVQHGKWKWYNAKNSSDIIDLQHLNRKYQYQFSKYMTYESITSQLWIITHRTAYAEECLVCQ